MRPSDTIRLAGGALLRQRRRSLLCLLGLSIGVAAVVLLTSLGEGARGFVSNQFESLGTNTIAVLPGKIDTSGGVPGFFGVPNDLTIADAETVLARVPRMLRVVPVVIGNDAVERNGLGRRVPIIGTSSAFLELQDLSLAAGRTLGEDSRESIAIAGDEAVLGATVARELFPDGSPVGARIRVAGWRLRVAGVLRPHGLRMGFDMDEVVFVPVVTGMRIFDKSSLFRMIVQTRQGTDMARTAERVRDVLIERHGEEDFTLTTPDAVVDALGKVLTALTLALAGIAAVSLSVAGIGIMNVMLVAVSERREEIGLYAALGAAPRQILVLFLTEAVLLSSTGGLLGLLLGTLAARAIAFVRPDFPATPPLWAILASLAVAAITGIVFSLIPARRAVRQDPVAALSGRSG